MCEAHAENQVRLQFGLRGAKRVLESPFILVQCGVCQLDTCGATGIMPGKYGRLLVEHEFGLEVAWQRVIKQGAVVEATFNQDMIIRNGRGDRRALINYAAESTTEGTGQRL